MKTAAVNYGVSTDRGNTIQNSFYPNYSRKNVDCRRELCEYQQIEVIPYEVIIILDRKTIRSWFSPNNRYSDVD